MLKKLKILHQWKALINYSCLPIDTTISITNLLMCMQMALKANPHSTSR